MPKATDDIVTVYEVIAFEGGGAGIGNSIEVPYRDAVEMVKADRAKFPELPRRKVREVAKVAAAAAGVSDGGDHHN